jgi:hypothetical protein
MVVDSPTAEAYATWQNSSLDDNQVFFDLYVYNLTNAEDFVHGRAPPNLQEVRRYGHAHTRRNVGQMACALLCVARWGPSGFCKQR